MNGAIKLYEHGGPEVMRWERCECGPPGRGEVLVRHCAVGVNFMDISQRRGRSPMPIRLPGGLGNEAAGIIEAVGPGSQIWLSVTGSPMQVAVQAPMRSDG